jgi:hypothetical protein
MWGCGGGIYTAQEPTAKRFQGEMQNFVLHLAQFNSDMNFTLP